MIVASPPVPIALEEISAPRTGAAIIDVELTAGCHEIRLNEDGPSRDHREVLIVARFHGRVVAAVSGASSLPTLAGPSYERLVWRRAWPAIRRLLADAGQPVAGGAEEQRELHGSGDRAVAAATAAALERRRSELVGSPAPVTVVICTQGRPAHLRRVLEALLALDYDPFEIVIVDNDPSSRHVADTVHDVAPSAMTATASPDGPRPGDAPIMRYVTEPRRGLSHARNAGLRAARGSIIAFTDDDAIVEPGWLTALAAGFGRDPDVGCVTGFTLPASLDTTAECQFEQFGGHSKARGLVDTLIDPADMPDGQHPLYPFPAFGAGVNMAFRREVLEEVGGFDPALGAGTLTKGCEDTAAFADVLLSGRKLAYEPMAVVHHFHRRTTNELVTQINGYGIALTAYFTWCLARRPRQALGLLGSVGKAVRYLLGRNPDHLSRQADEYPAQLTRAHRLGMVYGPFAYLRSALRERAR